MTANAKLSESIKPTVLKDFRNRIVQIKQQISAHDTNRRKAILKLNLSQQQLREYEKALEVLEQSGMVE
jgi:hypothetical protein